MAFFEDRLPSFARKITAETKTPIFVGAMATENARAWPEIARSETNALTLWNELFLDAAWDAASKHQFDIGRVDAFNEELDEVDAKTESLLQLTLSFGGDDVIDTLRTRLLTTRLSSSHTTSICEVIGRSKGALARNRSLNLLLDLLHSPVAHVRDAALIGLALLDDRRAIPRIEEALVAEKNRLIRRAAQEVILQLTEHA